MSDLTIYYEDSKASCRAYIEILKRDPGVHCKRASQEQEQPFLFEEKQVVGFLFESDGDKVPSQIRRMMQQLVMDKQGRCFLVVTGGNHELGASRAAAAELEKKGYRVTNLYTQYYFDKNHMDMERASGKILSDLEEDGEALWHNSEQYQGEIADPGELRKKLRQEMREYKKYRKEKKNKRK